MELPICKRSVKEGPKRNKTSTAKREFCKDPLNLLPQLLSNNTVPYNVFACKGCYFNYCAGPNHIPNGHFEQFEKYLLTTAMKRL
eukprot:4427904-Amphidinium_carterae.1